MLKIYRAAIQAVKDQQEKISLLSSVVSSKLLESHLQQRKFFSCIWSLDGQQERWVGRLPVEEGVIQWEGREMLLCILPPFFPPSPPSLGEMGPTWVPCWKENAKREDGQENALQHLPIAQDFPTKHVALKQPCISLENLKKDTWKGSCDFSTLHDILLLERVKSPLLPAQAKRKEVSPSSHASYSRSWPLSHN